MGKSIQRKRVPVERKNKLPEWTDQSDILYDIEIQRTQNTWSITRTGKFHGL